jgi:hypothetical protein
MAARDTKRDFDGLAMPMIFGILLGTVISAITGQWWWVAIGVAVGAAIGAGRSRSSGDGPSS